MTRNKSTQFKGGKGQSLINHFHKLGFELGFFETQFKILNVSQIREKLKMYCQLQFHLWSIWNS